VNIETSFRDEQSYIAKLYTFQAKLYLKILSVAILYLKIFNIGLHVLMKKADCCLHKSFVFILFSKWEHVKKFTRSNITPSMPASLLLLSIQRQDPPSVSDSLNLSSSKMAATLTSGGQHGILTAEEIIFLWVNEHFIRYGMETSQHQPRPILRYSRDHRGNKSSFCRYTISEEAVLTEIYI